MMTKTLGALLLAVGLSAQAAGTNTSITVAWDWPFPADLGGLSKVDYATNVVWQFYAATNVAGPYTASLSFSSANVVFDGNVGFMAILPATNRLAFFKLTAVTANGESDPSGVLPLLPVLGAGHLNSAKGSR